MSDSTQTLDVQTTEKQDTTIVNEAERTHPGKTYLPRVDIYETNEAVVAVADIPGVDENSVEITLEKNVLTLNGYVEPLHPEGYTLTYAEYGSGHYHRDFTLSNKIDQAKIEATVSNGVLRLYLPKAEPVKTRKIFVKTTDS